MPVAMCRNGELELAYERIGTPGGRPLLLVMAAGMPMQFWHDDFCALLVEQGFELVRFDCRDAGMSSRVPAGGYALEDLAADAVAVLDEVGWASAHVVGVSLGGMIGQVLAVRHPARVRSLTSMSSGPSYRFRTVRPKLGALLRLITLDRTGTAADAAIAMARVTGSPGYPTDEQWLRGLADLMEPDPAAAKRHLAAVKASGHRVRQLSTVNVATVVLHGEADPMQSMHAGRATAAAIPGARFVSYPGMGHDMPRALWPSFVAEICAVADRADGVVAEQGSAEDKQKRI